MFFLFVIFSLWPNLLILTLSRTDYIRDVTSTTGTSKGTWKDEVFCPDNTYIFSYNQLQECEFYGTNYIKVSFHLFSFFLILILYLTNL